MPKKVRFNLLKMRTSATLFSSLVVFTIIAIPSFSSAQTPVLDTDGNPVRAGEDYYAVPPAGTISSGGGLGLDDGVNHTCRFDVIQVRNQTSSGLPLFFSPVNPKDKVVNVGTDQNVQFNASTICATSTLWRLQEIRIGDLPPLFQVSTGGVVGNPGRQTLSNWFNIRRFEDAYVFNFCPTVCNTCRPVCGDIGVLVRDGRPVVGITNIDPLKVTFKKV